MGWFSSLVGGVVGFLVGGPVGALIGAGIGATKIGEKVVDSVLNFVTQPFMPSVDYNAGQEAERQQGVMVQRQGSIEQIPVIYGYRKTAGVIAFAETGSSNNKYLYVAYVFSEGLVEGLREVYIDDWLLPTDQIQNLNAGQLVTVNADKYKDRVQMRFYPGAYFDNPRNSTVGTTVKGDIFADAPSFTSDMVYNGLAVLFCRYEWKEIKTQADSDANPFSGNIPTVTVSLLGRRVASLLVDATENSTYASNPERYSTNPAECLLDYLRNPRYGKGLGNADIDWDTWKKAARKCNQTVTYVTGIQGPILTLNMVVDTGQTIMSNTKNILQNFRGYMPYVQGRYRLRIEDAGNDTDILSGVATIVATFNKDNIVSDITFNGIEKSAKYNVVSVTYVDPDQKFSNQTVVYPESESERQTYINTDGGRENKHEVTFGGITNYAIAKDMARMIFNKSRRQESCAFTATSQALELEPGDNIRIQSNILNFGEDPWRVISVKINNNMTVDIGCVRNPDDIYPHTRVGEQDIVLPPYIPKGSFIYYPSSQNTTPLGLIPPTYAVFPPTASPTPLNPAPTDPNAPGGGGVGGGNPPGGSTPPATGTPVPVPPSNVQPTQPRPQPAFDAVLGLRTSQLIDNGNSTYTFYLYFTQPQAATYDYALVWVRPNRYSPWTQTRLDNKPGAGLDIPWTWGPQGEGIFDVYARAYSTDGRAASRVLYVQISSRGDTRALGRTVTGQQVQTISEGWAVPSPEAAPTPKYDDDIDFLEIRPRLSAGAPLDPRRLDVTIQQLQNVITKPVNPLIRGFRIYYKLATDTFWSYEDFSWPANYIPGQKLTYQMTGDFGVRYSPNAWGSLQPGGAIYAAQTYEFMVMLNYSDNKAAEKYLPVRKGLVEYSGGLFDFAVYTTARTLLTSQPIGTFTWQTVDQNPNKSNASALATIPAIVSIVPFRGTSRLQINTSLPKDSVGNYFSTFLGYKIRYRKIIPGTNPAFTEVDTGRYALVDTVIRELGDFSYGEKYQFVITAVFRISGTETEATNSLVSDGVTITVSDQVLANVYAKFNFVTRETKEALGQLKATFPALPTVNARNWFKKQLRPLDVTGATTPDVFNESSTVRRINAYYQLVFQPTATADTLVIYRRAWSPLGAGKTTSTPFAKYFELGAWEKVVVPLSSLSTNADGFKVINVRGPLSHRNFAQYYQVSGYSVGLFDPYYGTTGAYFNNPSYSDFWLYGGVGDTNYTTNDLNSRYEFLFVMRTSGVEETRGLLLTNFYTEKRTSTGYRSEVDGFTAGVSRDTIVTVSDYNGFQAGYRRNINEAITASGGGNIAMNKLVLPGINPSSGLTLAQPGNGDTVY